MLTILLIALSLPATSPASPAAPGLSAARPFSAQENSEYEQKRKAAGEDVAKLCDLYVWCKGKKLEKEGRSTLRQILKIDKDHKEDNEALGNVFFDGTWFPSQKKVDEYKREQEEKDAKEKG